jgi:hypothetical protein
VKQRPLLRRSEPLHDLPQAGIDLVETGAQPVHRIVAGEHRAPDAEDLDCGEHDLAV